MRCSIIRSSELWLSAPIRDTIHSYQAKEPMLNITADLNGTISWVEALRLVNETAADQRNYLIRDFLQSAYATMRQERIDLGELNVWIIENN